jgi:glycerol uptake facilitator-like aquaporin
MGRYSWTYIIAPLIAAIFAGLLARFHLKALDKKFDD